MTTVLDGAPAPVAVPEMPGVRALISSGPAESTSTGTERPASPAAGSRAYSAAETQQLNSLACRQAQRRMTW
jgi:hypothetical protein